MRRVVVTGIGTVNALAQDVPGTFAALREGRCGIGPRHVSRRRPPDDPHRGRGARLAARRSPAAKLPLYDRVTQYALVAGAEAMAMAGLPDWDRRPRAGVILGTAAGGISHLGGQLSRGLCRGEVPGLAAWWCRG